jgi:hypothetical protein
MSPIDPGLPPLLTRPRPVSRLRVLGLLGLLGLATLLNGCATYHVSDNTEDPADIQYDQRTMHSFFWGLSNSPRVEEVDCQGAGLQDVKVKDNFGYDLLGVLTLGIWKPLLVQYRCRAG